MYISNIYLFVIIIISIYRYIDIYYMVVSVSLGFMYFTFIRQSDDFQKKTD